MSTEIFPPLATLFMCQQFLAYQSFPSSSYYYTSHTYSQKAKKRRKSVNACVISSYLRKWGEMWIAPSSTYLGNSLAEVPHRHQSVAKKGWSGWPGALFLVGRHDLTHEFGILTADVFIGVQHHARARQRQVEEVVTAASAAAASHG
jgi:hypothetical protein